MSVLYLLLKAPFILLLAVLYFLFASTLLFIEIAKAVIVTLFPVCKDIPSRKNLREVSHSLATNASVSSKYYVVEVQGKHFHYFSPAFPFHKSAIAYRDQVLRNLVANTKIRTIPLTTKEKDCK